MNVDNQIKGIISELFGMYPTDDDTFDSLLMDDFDKINNTVQQLRKQLGI